MESKPDREPTRRRRNWLLVVYGLGFVVLTNVLTVVFVLVFRDRPGAVAVVQAPAAVVSEAPDRVETRRVRVVSRPAGATVRGAGRTYGTTPVTIELPAGATEVLEVEKAGYRTRSVSVGPSRKRVSVRLARERGGGRAPAGRKRDARVTPRDATEAPAGRRRDARVTPRNATEAPARRAAGNGRSGGRVRAAGAEVESVSGQGRPAREARPRARSEASSGEAEGKAGQAGQVNREPWEQ